jgi:hypothetical protein
LLQPGNNTAKINKITTVEANIPLNLDIYLPLFNVVFLADQ